MTRPLSFLLSHERKTRLESKSWVHSEAMQHLNRRVPEHRNEQCLRLLSDQRSFLHVSTGQPHGAPSISIASSAGLRPSLILFVPMSRSSCPMSSLLLWCVGSQSRCTVFCLTVIRCPGVPPDEQGVVCPRNKDLYIAKLGRSLNGQLTAALPLVRASAFNR